jgi:hypothetical protein
MATASRRSIGRSPTCRASNHRTRCPPHQRRRLTARAPPQAFAEWAGDRTFVTTVHFDVCMLRCEVAARARSNRRRERRCAQSGCAALALWAGLLAHARLRVDRVHVLQAPLCARTDALLAGRLRRHRDLLGDLLSRVLLRSAREEEAGRRAGRRKEEEEDHEESIGAPCVCAGRGLRWQGWYVCETAVGVNVHVGR